MKRLTFVGLIALTVALAPVSRAATITVTSTNDSGDGSLRAALASASNGDTITFALPTPSLIKLASQLTISNNVSILGPGSDNLAVSGGSFYRVFGITTGQTVTIASLTITNGRLIKGGVPVFGGGGILNDHSTLTVSNCVIVGNSATTGGSSGIGGGIYNRGLGFGGRATLTVVNTTFRSNSVSGAGGAIANNGANFGRATATIIACCLVNNSASSSGGGIDLYGDGGSSSLTIIASTLSGNRAGWAGGGIYNNGGGAAVAIGTATVRMVACTLATNLVVNGTLTYTDNIYNYSIYAFNSSGTSVVEIADSILYRGGTGWNITNVFPGAVISDGYNLSDDNGGGFLTSIGDQINTDPTLGPLQDNGGPTFTHALRAGSPAIDQSKSGVIPALSRNTDQRGEPRYDDPNIPNAPGGDGSDIGAYEVAAFRVTGVDSVANDLRLSFTSTLGTDYFVQALSDLVTGSWAAVAGPIPGNGGIAQTTQTNALSESQQFYRVQLPP